MWLRKLVKVRLVLVGPLLDRRIVYRYESFARNRISNFKSTISKNGKGGAEGNACYARAEKYEMNWLAYVKFRTVHVETHTEHRKTEIESKTPSLTRVWIATSCPVGGAM